MTPMEEYQLTSMEEYQWRYRRPAPSLHEAFAEMAAGRCDQRCHCWRRFRRAVVALAGLLLLGLATSVVSWRAAHAENLPFAMAAAPFSGPESVRRLSRIMPDGHIRYSGPTRAEAWCRNFDTPNDAYTIATLR